MESHTDQPAPPAASTKPNRKPRNRKKNKQNKPPQDSAPCDATQSYATDVKDQSPEPTTVPPPDTPSTAPPAYTSTPAPASVPASLPSESVHGNRVPSPTTRSNASFESADSTGRRRRKPRGGRKRRSKALMVQDEGWAEEMDRQERGEQPSVEGSGKRRLGNEQEGGDGDGEGEGVVQRDLSEDLFGKDALEYQEQEMDQTNGVVVTGGVESRREFPMDEKEEEEEEEQQEEEDERKQRRPSISKEKKPFETGLKAFSIRKASSSKDHKPISIKTVGGAPESVSTAKKKAKKEKRKEKKKAKQRATGAEGEALPTETAEVEDEDEENPATQEPSSGEREVRIKLDLNLEIEVLLRTKIKGEIMITFFLILRRALLSSKLGNELDARTDHDLMRSGVRDI
ncbi:hypothetical protein CIHG_04864 [Coccidioides immitis H538.4]|uniref:Uncharacterized protein n=1 Tax=Coccidioides immitis H538.4 TaxID=396776 RepID=A0A0J8RP98_COCIT|nr:hypothetical protein CIHG_04864 [Coccidioides immitis H538.4]